MTEREIFAAALQQDDATERAAYLDEACGDDQRLRQRVELLLRAHEKAGSFLDLPSEESPATIEMPVISEGPGTVIGRYKLMEQIGEGGMGVVYVAHQEQPVKRKVALKIIKPGLDTAEVIARFEAERQALALMDHPNIAKVLDAGATETGRPYFVMELVKGVPITEYCDQNNLTTSERLGLFVSVCQAVQHAHQKGIIHRDIKPSNVLVTLHDGTPVVKVIDFGIAKAINQELTERTIYTRFAQMVGTPPYMSPEQAQLSALDVDTRSDVYSLGVLLYELLTGMTPFDKERLNAAAYDEIRRIIREEEPPKPSTKISTLGESATSVSTHRRTDPKGLFSLVRGDLDWIVMRALEKDRTRRYETAKDFADDVVRHGSDEPVVARPPSRAYRVRKFVRRNKGLVVSFTSLSLLLVVVVALITSSWIAEVQAKRMAEEALRTAQAERERATANSEIVEQQRDAIEETTERLRDSLKDMALAAAMGGQRARAEQFIASACDAGASESWEQMALGILCMFSGRSDEMNDVVAHLERAIELDPSNNAARSLLLRAGAIVGRGGADKLWIELQECEPKTAEEFLFLAWVTALMSPEKGLNYVRDALELRDSALVRAVKADVLWAYILARGRDDLIAEAFNDIQAARVYLPDNPFVLTTDLSLHHLAMLFAEGPSREGLRQQADDIVIELDRFPNYEPATIARALYLEDIGEEKNARCEYERGLELTDSKLFRVYFAMYLFRTRNHEALDSLCADDPVRLRLIGAIIEAERPGGRPRAIEALHAVVDECGSDVIDALECLALLGDGEYVKTIGERMFDSNNMKDNWGRTQMSYFAGIIDDEKLLEKAGDTNFLRCVANRCIAAKWLGEGNREKAKEYYEASVDTKAYVVTRASSNAFLERLKAPEWPPWIPAGTTTD